MAVSGGWGWLYLVAGDGGIWSECLCLHHESAQVTRSTVCSVCLSVVPALWVWCQSAVHIANGC